MTRLARLGLACLVLGLVLMAAPTAEASYCHHCECAKCVPYQGLGWVCDYVLEPRACDCLLGGYCNYNPTYCTNCAEYPGKYSCSIMSCGAPGQEACAKPQDLKNIEVIQEHDATT